MKALVYQGETPRNGRRFRTRWSVTTAMWSSRSMLSHSAAPICMSSRAMCPPWPAAGCRARSRRHHYRGRPRAPRGIGWSPHAISARGAALAGTDASVFPVRPGTS